MEKEELIQVITELRVLHDCKDSLTEHGESEYIRLKELLLDHLLDLKELINQPAQS